MFSHQNLDAFIFTRFATSVSHREILFQNDGYTAKGTVQLRVDEFGVFYVFVETDRYNRVSSIPRHILKTNQEEHTIFSFSCR